MSLSVLKLDALMDRIPLCVNLLDREMRIIKVNKLTEKVLGRSLEEIKGMHCYEVAGNGRICENCGVVKAIAEGETKIFERELGEHILH